jgi:hypothetical protein
MYRFGGTYTKIGTIQRRLAWPLRKDDTQNREAFHIFLFLKINNFPLNYSSSFVHFKYLLKIFCRSLEPALNSKNGRLFTIFQKNKN